MNAQIIHIPRQFVKPYSDPREQPVTDKYARLPTDAEVEAARLEAERERAALPYRVTAPGITEPIYLRALRSELPADTCAACGKPIAYHYDTSGCLLVGCDGVAARERVGQLVLRPLTFTEQYGDTYPAVSRALDDALKVACGTTVTLFYESLTASERLNLTRRLAEFAVLALRKSDAEGSR